MNSLIAFGPRLLAAAFLSAGLLLVPAQTATAQMADDTPTLIQHLRSNLRGDDATQREFALMDVVALANCPTSCTVSLRSIEDKKLSVQNETGTRTVVELDILIPDLVKAYQRGPADGHRLLALAALLNIGNEKALEQLVDESALQSKNVNRATHKGLAAFYLEKYPELSERVLRTRRLSLDDVRRVKAVRVRQMKKKG